MNSEHTPLIEQLRSNDPLNRLDGLKAVIRSGEPLVDWTTTLLRAVADPYEPISTLAISTLDDLEAPRPEHVMGIVRCMQRPADSEVVYWAVTMIGRMGPSASDAVPALTGVLANSPFIHVREKAAWALQELGPVAAGARSVLQSAVVKGPPRLSRIARGAVEMLQRAEAA